MHQQQIIISKIREKREALKLNQDYIASELGINTRTYSNIELGKSEVSLKNFLKLCDILKTQPSEFFNPSVGQISNSNYAANCEHFTNQYYIDKEMIEHLKEEIQFYRSMLKNGATSE